MEQLLVLDFINQARKKQLQAIQVLQQLRGKRLWCSDSFLPKSFAYCVWEDCILVLGASSWKHLARSDQKTSTFQETWVAKGCSALWAKFFSNIPSSSNMPKVMLIFFCLQKNGEELLVFVCCLVKAVKGNAVQGHLECVGKGGRLASTLKEYSILHIAELWVVLIALKYCSLTSWTAKW